MINLLMLLVSSVPVSAQTVLPAAEGQRLMQCVRDLITNHDSRRPTEQDLALGQNWRCATLTLAAPPEGSTEFTEYQRAGWKSNAVAYRFEKNGHAYDNLEGTAHRNRQGRVDYLGFTEPVVPGMLGLPFGIYRGFLMDFLRMSARGELISEESVFDVDVPRFPVGGDTPEAIIKERQKAYRYSVCRTETTVTSAPLSCF
jgi:hypothetical protein